MDICIIGLGLIGGSLARDLRHRQLANHIYGVDHNEVHTEQALQMGLVDEVLSLSEGLAKSDLIVLAIPVDAARKLLAPILDQLSEQQTVMDMGSTKAGICAEVKDHPQRHRYVAAHPIAGTEYSGPGAAILGLYQDKVMILCDPEKSAADALQQVRQLSESVGLQVVEMPAEEHDKHLAYVSHLSHVSSFTLGLTVLDIEKSERTILDLAGSGFASTVRLAKSSPEMWAPIFEQNKPYLLEALNAYLQHLTEFRDLIEAGDTAGTTQRMQEANEIRRILDR